MTPRTAAGREHVRMWGPGDDMAGADYAAFVADVKRIEAEAIDARVAALVEAISRLPSSGGINYGDGVPPEHNLIERSAVLALLSDLATAAAERDARLRADHEDVLRERGWLDEYAVQTNSAIDHGNGVREGWDAALAAVRPYCRHHFGCGAIGTGPAVFCNCGLDRLAAEGPR